MTNGQARISSTFHLTLGSAAELETQLIISKELGFTEDKELEGISEKIDHLSKMLSSLLKNIASRID
jgi:four helix bundle protein